MGRIKTKLVKRTSRQIIEKVPEGVSESFEDNKKLIRGTMSSKRTRNMIAGYIARLKRNNKKILAE